MTFQSDIASDVQKAELGNVIYLYELDLGDIGSNQILYFTPVVDDDYTPITFNARDYVPIEMETEGWEVSTGEQLPRPHLRVSNATLSFLAHVITFEDLIGAKLTRRRTLEKYLDGNPEANPSAEFAKDIFVIFQKTAHTKRYIEFELAAYMDFEGIRIPKRQIIRDYCTHSYRTFNTSTMTFDYTFATCPYGNPEVPGAGGGYKDARSIDESPGGRGEWCYTRLGARTPTCQDDQCGKSLTDCEVRFAGNRVLSEDGNYVIQETAPLSPSVDDIWLYNDGVYLELGNGQTVEPYTWYQYNGSLWLRLKPFRIPTRAFPGVSRFRV
jgi:lambda family phage minor tail protein L